MTTRTITTLILFTLGPISALLFHIITKRVIARRVVRQRLLALIPENGS